MKNDNEKEFVCRVCLVFLDAEELDNNACPVCHSDEGLFINDINEEEDL